MYKGGKFISIVNGLIHGIGPNFTRKEKENDGHLSGPPVCGTGGGTFPAGESSRAGTGTQTGPRAETAAETETGEETEAGTRHSSGINN